MLTPVILAWKIPWTEEPGGLQSRGSQRAGNNWAHRHTEFTVIFSRFFREWLNIHSLFCEKRGLIQVLPHLWYLHNILSNWFNKCGPTGHSWVVITSLHTDWFTPPGVSLWGPHTCNHSHSSNLLLFNLLWDFWLLFVTIKLAFKIHLLSSSVFLDKEFELGRFNHQIPDRF